LFVAGEAGDILIQRLLDAEDLLQFIDVFRKTR